MTSSLIIVEVSYPNTHTLRLFSDIRLSAGKPAAAISTSEAKTHQGRIIHIRNKNHDLKDKTSILEKTHTLILLTVCLLKWDRTKVTCFSKFTWLANIAAKVDTVKGIPVKRGGVGGRKTDKIFQAKYIGMRSIISLF